MAQFIHSICVHCYTFISQQYQDERDATDAIRRMDGEVSYITIIVPRITFSIQSSQVLDIVPGHNHVHFMLGTQWPPDVCANGCGK
jgi:hypothetical protein